MVLEWITKDRKGVDLVLASGSPRRALICERAGLTVLKLRPEVEESVYESDPERTVAENARRKLLWALPAAADLSVVAADTVVSLDGEVIGKPASLEEAEALFLRFSGRRHSVFTGLGFAAPGVPPAVQVLESRVRFLELTPERIAAYMQKVDPLDKAGGYDIDQSSDLLIASYEGSYSNIMGLPIDHLVHLLNQLGPRGS